MEIHTVQHMERRPMIILSGPTAVGKTSLSIRLAKALDGEIISADSMQIYKHMNIGTAKVTPEEMCGVPHHLVNELEPDDPFHVVEFQKRARRAAEEIYSRGRIPIVVGGTGFYIQALLYDVDFAPHEATESYRKELQALAEERGGEYLHDMLRKVDPAYAASVHHHNIKRVIRALEYHQETGGRLSEHNQKERARTSPYNFACFVLTHDRQVLYDRINDRVEQMMEQGLEEEVKDLIQMGWKKEMVSAQAIGYREFFPYLEGQQSREEMIEQIKKDTRHFAKRQLTWFRRERDVIWLSKAQYPEEEVLLEQMMTVLQEKGIWNPAGITAG